MFIYKISSTVTDKVYIGLTTTSVHSRWQGHMYTLNTGDKKPLYNAMRKYGVDTFSVECIDSSATSINELKDLEKMYIKKYDCRAPKGYNLTDGGETTYWDGDTNPSGVESISLDTGMLYPSSKMAIRDNMDYHSWRVIHSDYESIYRINFQVRCVTTDTIYLSYWDAEMDTGVSVYDIERCVHGYTMSAGGLEWELPEYYDEYCDI